MNDTSRWSRLTTRTTLITGAAIAGVVIAGGAAVAANIGILDAADDDALGTLSSAGDLSTQTEVIDVYLDGETTSTTLDDSAGDTQEFAVDRAGLVTVAERAGALRVAEVTTNPGWTWSIGADDAPTVVVRLTDGTRTLVFTATLGADGTISGDVAETTAPPASGGPVPGDDDSFDDDELDDDDSYDDEDEHEDEDDDEDEDEHEGRDDDD